MKRLFFRFIATALVPVIIGADAALATSVRSLFHPKHHQESTILFTAQAFQTPLKAAYRRAGNDSGAVSICKSAEAIRTTITLHMSLWQPMLLAALFTAVSAAKILPTADHWLMIAWPGLVSFFAACLIVSFPAARQILPTSLAALIVGIASGYALWPLESHLLRILGTFLAVSWPVYWHFQAEKQFRPIGNIDRFSKLSFIGALLALAGMLTLGSWQGLHKKTSSDGTTAKKNGLATTTFTPTVSGLQFYQGMISYIPPENGEVVSLQPRSQFSRGEIVVAWIGASDKTKAQLPSANETLSEMKLPGLSLASLSPTFGANDHPLLIMQPTDKTATDHHLQELLSQLAALKEPYMTLVNKYAYNDKLLGTSTDAKDIPELANLRAQASLLVSEIKMQDNRRRINSMPVTATGNFRIVQALLAGKAEVYAGVPVPIFEEQLDDILWVNTEIPLTGIWQIEEKWKHPQADLRFQVGDRSFSIPMQDVQDLRSGAANSFEGPTLSDPTFGTDPSRNVEFLIPGGVAAAQMLGGKGMTYRGLYVNGEQVFPTVRDRNDFFVFVHIGGATVNRTSHLLLAKTAALDSAALQSQIKSQEAQALAEEEAQRRAGGGVPDSAQRRIDQNRSARARQAARISTLEKEKARLENGIQVPKGLAILQGGQAFYPMDLAAYLGYRLASPLPGPAESWIALGPGVTIRLDGGGLADRLPEAGNMIDVTFPTGQTLPCQVVSTKPQPGSTNWNTKNVSLVGTIKLNDLGKYFPGAPAGRLPTFSMVKINLPPKQKAETPPAPKIAVPFPSRDIAAPQKPSPIARAWMRPVLASLQTLVVVTGLAASALAQQVSPPKAVPPQAPRLEATQQIALTNLKLATQGSAEEWTTKDIPVEQFQRLEPSDLMEFFLQHNLQLSKAFFRHREALQRVLVQKAPKKSILINLDRSRAPGLIIQNGGPKLDPTTLIHTDIVNPQPRERLETASPITPLGILGARLGFNIVSQTSVDKTKLDDQLAEVRPQIEFFNMAAVLDTGVRAMFQLYYRLLHEDVEISRRLFHLRVDQAISDWLRSPDVRKVQPDTLEFESIRKQIAIQEQLLFAAYGRRQQTESELVKLIGSKKARTAFAEAAQAALRNRQTRSAFTFLRPTLAPFRVTHEAIDLVGGSYFPKDLDDRFRKALREGLDNTRRSTPERLEKVRTLCFFSSQMDDFLIGVFLNAPSPSPEPASTVLELAQYKGPSFVSLFKDMPSHMSLGLIPAEDIVNAEMYYAELRKKRAELDKRSEFRLSASLKPGYDSARGPWPFLAGLLGWQWQFTDPEAAQLTQYELQINQLGRRQEIQAFQSDQESTFVADLRKRALAQDDAAKAQEEMARLGKLVLVRLSMDQRGGTEPRSQVFIDWRDMRDLEFRLTDDAIAAAEQSTLVSLQAEFKQDQTSSEPSRMVSGPQARQDALLDHYGEVFKNLQELPLPKQEAPKPRKSWWKNIPYKEILRHPGLMRGVFTGSDINSYITGRMTIPEDATESLMREGWRVRDGVPEDVLVMEKAYKALQAIEDPRRLFYMAYLLDLSPSRIPDPPRKLVEILKEKNSRKLTDDEQKLLQKLQMEYKKRLTKYQQTLRDRIFERFQTMLDQTHFSFNQPEGTGYHLPFFRRNAGTLEPEFVAMHYGLFKERRNIYVLSHALWEGLMEEGNESALLGTLLYELSKVEWLQGDRKGSPPAIREGTVDSDEIAGLKNLRNRKELQDASDYQKRALRLLSLADVEDRLGWFKIQDQYQTLHPLQPLRVLLDEPVASTSLSEGILDRLAREDIERGGHNPYAVRPIPRTNRDTDTGSLRSFLDILNSVIPEWAVRWHPGESKKLLTSRDRGFQWVFSTLLLLILGGLLYQFIPGFAPWMLFLWVAISTITLFYVLQRRSQTAVLLRPFKIAYKIHQFDGPRYGLSRVTSSMIYRLHQSIIGSRRQVVAELKRTHYVFGIVAFIGLYLLVNYIPGVRAAIDQFYERNSFFISLRQNVTLEWYERIRGLIENFVLAGFAFVKWLIEGGPVLASLLWAKMLIPFSIRLESRFDRRTRIANPADLFDPTNRQSASGLKPVNPADESAIAYVAGLQYVGSSVMLGQFVEGLPELWHLLMTIMSRSDALPLPPGVEIVGAEKVVVPSEQQEGSHLMQEFEDPSLIQATGTLQLAQIAETKLRILMNPVYAYFACQRYGVPLLSRPSKETEQERKWAGLLETVVRRLLWHTRLLFPTWFEHHERYDLLLSVFRLHYQLRRALENGLVDEDLQQELHAVYQPREPDEKQTWQKLLVSPSGTRRRQNLDAGDLDVIFRWATRLFALHPPNEATALVNQTGQLYPNEYLPDWLLKGQSGAGRIHLSHALEAQIDASWLIEQLIAQQGKGRLLDDLPVYIEASLLLPTDAMRDLGQIEQLTKGRVKVFTANPTLDPFVVSLKNQKSWRSRVEFVSFESVKKDLASPSSSLVYLPPEFLSWELTKEGKATFVRVPNWTFLKSSIVYSYQSFAYGRDVRLSPDLWNEVRRHKTNLLERMLDTNIYNELHEKKEQGGLTSPERHDALFILIKGENQPRRERIETPLDRPAPAGVTPSADFAARRTAGAA